MKLAQSDGVGGTPDGRLIRTGGRVNRTGSAMVQGQLWGRAAHDWAELQEPTALPLWEAMLDAAAVGPGTHMLDAGCGAGGASVLAVGRGAYVNGLDAAEALLTIARRRVPDGDFHLGDLEMLPYADGAFEAILMADVLPYVANREGALREVRRVCVPGGRLALAIWGRPEECEQYVIVRTLRQLLPTPLGEEPFSLSASAVLDAIVAQNGLRVVGDGSVVCPAEYPDEEIACQALVATGPMQAALRVVGRQQLTAVVLAAIAPFRTSSGGVRLVNRFRYLTTTPLADWHSQRGPGTD
jgi:SAM-dependent methyltransferase